MKRKIKSDFARWVHLVHVTELIQERRVEKTLTPEIIREYLGSVEEAFGDLSDPIEEFPSFALLRFCRELGVAVEFCAKAEGKE